MPSEHPLTIHSVKGTTLNAMPSPTERTSNVNDSKTFLARLCEQAERYDGKHHPNRIRAPLCPC